MNLDHNYGPNEESDQGTPSPKALQKQLALLSTRCIKLQNRMGLLYDHHDSFDSLTESWKNIQTTLAKKTANVSPTLARWIENHQIHLKHWTIEYVEAEVGRIVDGELVSIAEALAQCARTLMSPGQAKAFGACLSYCDSILTQGPAALCDDDFEALASASMAIPSNTWALDKLSFTWDDQDSKRRFGAISRGSALLHALATRPHLPGCVQAAIHLQTVCSFTWDSSLERISTRLFTVHHEPESIRFWLSVCRHGVPAWPRAACLRKAMMEGVDLSEQDFKFEFALESALMSGTPEHVAMAMASKTQDIASISATGLPLALIAASSPTDPEQKLRILHEAGVDLSLCTSLTNLQHSFEDLAQFMCIFQKETHPIHPFLDSNFLPPVMKAPVGIIQSVKEHMRLTLIQDQPSILQEKIDVNVAIVLHRRGMPMIISWLSSLDSKTAEMVATTRFEVMKPPQASFSIAALDQYAAIGRPLNQERTLRWWFDSGWEKHQGQPHAVPGGAFVVTTKRALDLGELQRRGYLDQVGASIILNESTLGFPERLRYGKLALLMGIPFTTEQASMLRHTIKEQFTINADLFKEGTWIENGALAAIESIELSHITPNLPDLKRGTAPRL